MSQPNRFQTIKRLGFMILLAILIAACSPTGLSRLLHSPTATPPKIPRSPRPITLAPTLNPPPSPTGSPTPRPTLPPPPPSPSPLTRQGDKIPRTSQRDTLRPRPPNRPSLPATLVTIRCAVAAEALPLREGPAVNYTTITRLPAGTVLTARKCLPGTEWLLVETSDQAVGWARTDLLSCRGDPAILPVAVGITPQERERQ